MLQNLNAPKSVASQREMDMFHSSATARKRGCFGDMADLEIIISLIAPARTSVFKKGLV